MISMHDAKRMFPDLPPDERMRYFHDLMLQYAKRNIVVACRGIGGQLYYFYWNMLPDGKHVLTYEDLERAQDEMRRIFNFPLN